MRKMSPEVVGNSSIHSRMRILPTLLFGVVLVWTTMTTTTTDALTIPTRNIRSNVVSGGSRSSSLKPIIQVSSSATTTRSSVTFLSAMGNDDESKEAENKDETSQPKVEDEVETKKKPGGFLPFFSRLIGPQASAASANQETEMQDDQATTATTTTTAVVAEPEPSQPVVVAKPSPSPPVVVAAVTQSPADQAKSLREQAERVRLEAERMDAELTLSKIEKLEKQLANAKTKGESVDDLQRQMDNLQAKLRGEAPKPYVVPQATPKPKATPKVSLTSKPNDKPTIDVTISAGNKISNIEISGLTNTNTNNQGGGRRRPEDLISGDDLQEIQKNYDNGPAFIKKIIASMVEMDYTNVTDINSTELALRTIMMKNGDFSYSQLPPPTFTQEQIDQATTALKSDSWEAPFVTEEMTKLANGNTTLLALYGLEHEYYAGSKLSTEETAMAELGKITEGEDWLKGIIEAVNQTAVDAAINTLYPKCTRKEEMEGQPTQAQVQRFASTVLPQVKFSSTGKPEPVIGGYLIRGNHKYETGDELIAAIDKELAKTNLQDKMTVIYTRDFSVFAGAAMDEEAMFDLMEMEDVAPILYVLGPDITRERKRAALSVTTALGIATSWYLAIYPFLLNPTLGKRIDEQLGLAEAGMPYDLDWLTELSIPLFAAFIGIQLSHEIAHRLVASIYNIKITLPTFVPSLITGTTSAVTTFKEPPPNKDAMFDFSIAGPLAGLLASVAAVVIGSQLTLVSDPSTLPALPLEILRQSALGGTIINDILGNGALTVSEGALGSQAVAGMVIPLHPIAIAGYVSLFVNALSLLPIGTTDGGRMALCLFGRDGKLFVGNIAMSALLFTGLLGSDLFLFYFAFVIAFQTGNEIPARNEVDSVSFSRVLVALTSFVAALLVLVPFQ